MRPSTVLLSALLCTLCCARAGALRKTPPSKELVPTRKEVLQYRELRESTYWKVAKSRARIVVVLGQDCGTETPPPLVEAAEGLPEFKINVTDCINSEEPCPFFANGTQHAGINLVRHGVSNHGGYKQAYSAVFRRARDEIRRAGWDNFEVVAFNSSEERELVPVADVVIAPLIEYEETLKARYPYARWIIIHTDDSATIRQGLAVDSLDIIGILMHTGFRDPLENNNLAPYQRRHSAWMLGSDVDGDGDGNSTDWLRDPPISPRNLYTKVHTIIPQIMRWAHPEDCGGSEDFEVFATHAFGQDKGFAPPLASRPIDIAFIGHIGEDQVIHKAKSELLNHTVYKKSNRNKMGSRAHRLSAAENVREIATKHNLTAIVVEGKVSYSDYVQLLRKTKIFVSPFGIGEFSGKDYEAILAGALLVKPLAHKIEAYPNIYRNDITLETQANFSDLEKVVMPFLNSASHLEKKGQHMSFLGQRLLERHNNMKRFAHDFDEVLEQLLLQHPVIGDLR